MRNRVYAEQFVKLLLKFCVRFFSKIYIQYIFLWSNTIFFYQSRIKGQTRLSVLTRRMYQTTLNAYPATRRPQSPRRPTPPRITSRTLRRPHTTPFNYSTNFLSPVHLKIDHVKGSDERSLRDRCWISCSFDKLIATAPSHPRPYGSLWTRIVFLIWLANWVSEWVGLECDWTRLINSMFYRRQHESEYRINVFHHMIFRQRVGFFFRVLRVWKLQISTNRTKCYGGVSVDDEALQCFSTSSYQSLPFRFSVLFLFWICFEREQMLLTRNPCRYFSSSTTPMYGFFHFFFQAPTRRTKGELACVVLGWKKKD